MSFKKYLKTYFSYSASERRSLIVLLTVVVLLFGYPFFIPDDKVKVWDADSIKQKQLDSLLLAMYLKVEKKEKEKNVYSRFVFDPNETDSLSLMTLGFSAYQARNLLSYIKSGGRINTAIDLQKVYGMTDDLYQSLKPYVNISSKSKLDRSKFVNIQPFNPNKLDSLGFIELGFSKLQTQNILSFRRKSGCFREKKDLMKIYGIDSMEYSRVKEYVDLPLNFESTPYNLFVFNPNEIGESEWDSLGVDSRVAARIQNYLSKGGCFVKAEDLGKIYGFDSLKFAELLPYIQITKKEKREISKIDLNEVDSSQLVSLSGIGPYFSQRILDYRKKLGGFLSLDQLSDIRGMRLSRIDSLKPFLFVNTKSLRQININEASVEELSFHPYISYQEASDIVRLRKRKKQIVDINVLLKKKIIRESNFKRLEPYLILE
ncbi:helix-hairpin-helix domain-containing protein [Ancylomarina sp. DW003]|nr:helix-hairpin-helix domain-containing protein [Ancylomarina sp. DW003]MDE5423765.1 helix-hairpin-helix domain-containing protein [Ancylomarina sp. DW003]